MKEIKELFLDTTYVMPFFYLDIDVKGFSREAYRDFIASIESIHISEISIIEAKAKSLKIGRKQGNIIEINNKFNEGLNVLIEDEKVEIHQYMPADDHKFNDNLVLGLGFFDSIILAQSYQVGCLLTEDLKLLKLSKDAIGDLNIINWKFISAIDQ